MPTRLDCPTARSANSGASPESLPKGGAMTSFKVCRGQQCGARRCTVVAFLLILAINPTVLLAAETTVDDLPRVLKYGDGKADGKKSCGGSGEMIRFELPEGASEVRGIRIHGSRYGY